MCSAQAQHMALDYVLARTAVSDDAFARALTGKDVVP
jgi:hypothetical protein